MENTAITSVRELRNYIQKHEGYSFRAILFATREDKQVLNYFAEFREEMHHATGNICLLFLFKQELKHHRQSYDPNKMYDTMMMPYEPEISYDFANELGVPYCKLPCLVVFEKLDSSSQELAILTLPNNEDLLRSKMRGILDIMKECGNSPEGLRLDCFKSKVTHERIRSKGQILLSNILEKVLNDSAGRLFSTS